ncbi:MAG: hypothetical protein GTN67_07820, partial [Hydrotalea flava]|nr:hypothetical protein [Hydrotalea flava]NIM38147.1 hypothetical protein [Hydrotalea flava]NIN03311.1 hypothetical protein [Hydrotalea flava]NIN15005.1 hypothetical protein [Hydrotalea flava]NIO94073.1 hypothetical protein [Hydrotalea flava]
MKKILFLFFFITSSQVVFCEDIALSKKIADATILSEHVNANNARRKWNYEDALVLKDLTALWQYTGRVLAILHNDKGNADFVHMNQLTKCFGIQLNEDNYQKVVGKNFENGAISVPDNHPILPDVQTIFEKEICSIKVKKPAYAALVKKDITIFAVANYGKGTVFVAGDPWLYNEYTDGRK